MKQLILTSLTAFFAAPMPAHAEEILLMEKDDYVWESTPEGVAFAALEGDRFSEAYQALVILPSGTTSPPHVKSATMYGVLLQGEMLHYATGKESDAAGKIGPGSFYRIPGNLVHVSACVSEDPCITYLYQDGAFDFRPIEQ